MKKRTFKKLNFILPKSVQERIEAKKNGTFEETKRQTTLKGKSRNDLMLDAKEKGIKNFRILNKEELTAVLDEKASPETIKEITAKAVERWKSGWGSKDKLGNIPTETLNKSIKKGL